MITLKINGLDVQVEEGTTLYFRTTNTLADTDVGVSPHHSYESVTEVGIHLLEGGVGLHRCEGTALTSPTVGDHDEGILAGVVPTSGLGGGARTISTLSAYRVTGQNSPTSNHGTTSNSADSGPASSSYSSCSSELQQLSSRRYLSRPIFLSVISL